MWLLPNQVACSVAHGQKSCQISETIEQKQAMESQVLQAGGRADTKTKC